MIEPIEETGNLRPLLHELQHALRVLLEENIEHQIDLRALPLSASEESRLERLLDTGEVQALVNTLGSSEVRETAIAGVWLVTHYSEAGEVIGKIIEVARCPWLLQAQHEDILIGQLRLECLLDEFPAGEERPEQAYTVT